MKAIKLKSGKKMTGPGFNGQKVPTFKDPTTPEKKTTTKKTGINVVPFK
jgi:hypothetical protein